jgi:hypothetical protein
MNLLLHRLAAFYLRLRKKRPPLEDLISAWSGGRWDPRCYELPREAPSPGELVAGVDGSRIGEGPARAQEHDRQAGAVRLADSAGPGAWATDAPAAVKQSQPAGERSAGA